MIGFTPNEAKRTEKTAPAKDREEIDFDKIRAELLDLGSVEVRDAYDDYNRSHRSL